MSMMIPCPTNVQRISLPSSSPSPSDSASQSHGALATTGFDGIIFFIVALAFVALGVVASLGAKTFKAKIFAVATPIIALAWLWSSSPRPAEASPAAAVVSDVVLDVTAPGGGAVGAVAGTIHMTISQDAVFSNAGAGATKSYQWLVAQFEADPKQPCTQTDYPTSSDIDWTCPVMTPSEFAWLQVTLTGPNGTVTSTSRPVAIGPCV